MSKLIEILSKETNLSHETTEVKEICWIVHDCILNNVNFTIIESPEETTITFSNDEHYAVSRDERVFELIDTIKSRIIETKMT